MLKKFLTINYSLNEELLQQTKTLFIKNHPEHKVLPLQKLPQLLHQLKIDIPDSMLKDLNRCLKFSPNSTFTFRQFTHYVARASLENEVQQQIRHLFQIMDRKKNGFIYPHDFYLFMKELKGSQRLQQSDVDGAFDEIDAMKLGFITYEDFVYMMLPK